MKIEAYAKINWRLAVTGRRADGYHTLHGLMQSISLCDTLRLTCAEHDVCLCEPALPGAAADNLALRAWLLLKARLGLRDCLRIEIEKRIPLGGGLAGGSADAAAVLRGANELLALGLSLRELQALGLELGADIPFCLQNGLALAAGVGEQLTALPAAPPLHLLLAHDGQAVATPRVFAQHRASGQAFTPLAQAQAETEAMAQALAAGDLAVIRAGFRNDLQASARALYPNLGLVEQVLREVGLEPLMTGSGGVFFALCENEAAARAAQAALFGRLAWVEVVRTLA